MPSPRTLPFMLLFAGLAVTGCYAEEDDSQAERTSAPDDSEVVATVDDEPLTEVDLDAQIQAMATRGEAPGDEQALEELIDLRLLEQRAKRQDIHRQPEVAAEIRRQRAMLLANHLIQAEIQALDIDDEMLRAEYEEYVADATQRREYNARHILVEDRETALGLIGDIEDGGDFAELAREHSTGPSGDRGGDLDWFRADEVVEPFAEAVSRLQPGEYTGEPVETRFGWHVILLEDARDTEADEFDEMRDTLREQKINEHVSALLRDLRADSEIDIR